MQDLINTFLEEIKLTSKQQKILSSLKEGNDIFSRDLKDILYSFGYYIKYEQLDSNTLNCAKNIMNECVFEEQTDEQVISGIYYVWDTIKYRLANTNKNDKETRKILKSVREIFDFIIKNYRGNDVQHDYLFNVVDYFLNEEDYYIYLKNIVEKVPNLVNCKHVTKDKKTEHVVLYIIDKFIENYKIMLKDKKNKYINKDYLKEVYLLFTRSQYICLTSDERKAIDDKLTEFMKYVNINITSSKRKNIVQNDLKQMRTDKFYMDPNYELIKDVNEYMFEEQLNMLYFKLKSSTASIKREDKTEQIVTFFNDKYHAYSLIEEEDKTILEIHVLDLYNIINDSSVLEIHMFNQLLQKENIEPFIESTLRFNYSDIFPTITYKIIVDEKNNIDFDFCQSKIKISSNKDLEKYEELFRRVSKQKHFSIYDFEQYFKNILNEKIIEYFNEHKFPFLYSGVCRRDEEEVVDIISNLGSILSRLDEKSFHDIYKALEDCTDEYHYSMCPFNGEYDTDIQNPMSYMGLMSQRMLHELVLNERYTDEDRIKIASQYERKMETMVSEFNQFNYYVDRDLLQHNKGRLKKVKRIKKG